MAEFLITRKDWDKVITFAKGAHSLYKTEIGGMMIMYKDDDGDYILTDPVILTQTVTASNCVLDEQELALYYGKAHKRHKAKGKIRYVWWHSHGDMKAFWSTTDDSTIEETITEDFSVSLVVNIKQEYKLRVQYFHPTLLDEDVDLIIMGKSKAIPKKIVDEIEAKCTKPAYKAVTTYKNGKKVKEDAYQENMFNQSYGNYGGYGYDVYPYNQGYHRDFSPDGRISGHVPYTTLVTYIDGLNTQYVKGEIKYKTWKSAVTKTNSQLKERGCEWVFEIPPTEQAMEEVIYTSQPGEFISSEEIV